MFRQFSFVSLALVSKGCCVISLALFKICGEAHVYESDDVCVVTVAW